MGCHAGNIRYVLDSGTQVAEVLLAVVEHVSCEYIYSDSQMPCQWADPNWNMGERILATCLLLQCELSFLMCSHSFKRRWFWRSWPTSRSSPGPWEWFHSAAQTRQWTVSCLQHICVSLNSHKKMLIVNFKCKHWERHCIVFARDSDIAFIAAAAAERQGLPRQNQEQRIHKAHTVQKATDPETEEVRDKHNNLLSQR